jgi:hypothetical protein
VSPNKYKKELLYSFYPAGKFKRDLLRVVLHRASREGLASGGIVNKACMSAKNGVWSYAGSSRHSVCRRAWIEQVRRRLHGTHLLAIRTKKSNWSTNSSVASVSAVT